MKILKIQFWGIILVNVLILVLFMTGLLPQGYFATDKNMIYVLSMACVFFTLGDIYLSWRMLGTAKAKKQVREQGFILYSVKCQIRIIHRVLLAHLHAGPVAGLSFHERV